MGLSPQLVRKFYEYIMYYAIFSIRYYHNGCAERYHSRVEIGYLYQYSTFHVFALYIASWDAQFG